MWNFAKEVRTRCNFLFEMLEVAQVYQELIQLVFSAHNTDPIQVLAMELRKIQKNLLIF